MDNILMVAGRVVCAILIFILAVLVWKTAEYFNTLPDSNKVKPLLAWDVLALFVMLIALIIKLVAI